MRTPQEALRDALPAIQAAAEGAEIQCRLDKEVENQPSDLYEWTDVCPTTATCFANPWWRFRVKPEPKRTLRPWNPEEVPVGALLKSNGSNWKWVLTQFEGDRIAAGHNIMTRSACFERYEHSTDGGKTWHPCGVWEEEA